MKKRGALLSLLALFVALAIAAMIPLSGLADAGNFSGDSDYGGSDYSSSDSDWDSDWSSSSSSSSSSGGGGSLIGLIIVVVIVVIIIRSKGGGKPTGGSGASSGPAQMPQREIDSGLAKLKEEDPEFSREAFLERVSNMYVQLQEAWEAKKWEPIRIMMTDALYNQFKRQLDEYIRNNQTNHVDRIAVLSADMISYRQDEVNDIIKVLLKTRIVDYVVNDADGSLVSGDRSREKFMTYEWTLIRAKGVKTTHDQGVGQINCPSCGAPMSINQSGKCEYCGSVLTSGQYDWIISAIRGISQVTR